jgi:hypothetical protein
MVKNAFMVSVKVGNAMLIGMRPAISHAVNSTAMDKSRHQKIGERQNPGLEPCPGVSVRTVVDIFSRQILNEKKKRWPRRFAKASA